jgi:hypothetical protein
LKTCHCFGARLYANINYDLNPVERTNRTFMAAKAICDFAVFPRFLTSFVFSFFNYYTLNALVMHLLHQVKYNYSINSKLSCKPAISFNNKSISTSDTFQLLPQMVGWNFQFPGWPTFLRAYFRYHHWLPPAPHRATGDNKKMVCGLMDAVPRSTVVVCVVFLKAIHLPRAIRPS